MCDFTKSFIAGRWQSRVIELRGCIVQKMLTWEKTTGACPGKLALPYIFLGRIFVCSIRLTHIVIWLVTRMNLVVAGGWALVLESGGGYALSSLLIRF